jgi:hypothetical protein
MKEWLVNQRYTKNRPWPNLKHYPGICVEDLEKVRNSVRLVGLWPQKHKVSRISSKSSSYPNAKYGENAANFHITPKVALVASK